MRYTTISEVIDQAIAPTLGEYADDYDMDAIARATHEWMIDTDDAGNELLNTGGFEQTVTTEEFWAIAEAHDTTSSEATGFTAWLTTQADMTVNGERCEISVTEDEPTGTPEPMPATQIPVTAGTGSDEAARESAETELNKAGWRTVSEWEQFDHGYSASVRRA